MKERVVKWKVRKEELEEEEKQRSVSVKFARPPAELRMFGKLAWAS